MIHRQSWRPSTPRPTGSTTSDCKYLVTVQSSTLFPLQSTLYSIRMCTSRSGRLGVPRLSSSQTSNLKLRYGWITPRKGVQLEQLPSNTSATASFSSGSVQHAFMMATLTALICTQSCFYCWWAYSSSSFSGGGGWLCSCYACGKCWLSSS